MNEFQKIKGELNAGVKALENAVLPFHALALYEGLNECILNLFHAKWEEIYAKIESEEKNHVSESDCNNS